MNSGQEYDSKISHLIVSHIGDALSWKWDIMPFYAQSRNLWDLSESKKNDIDLARYAEIRSRLKPTSYRYLDYHEHKPRYHPNFKKPKWHLVDNKGVDGYWWAIFYPLWREGIRQLFIIPHHNGYWLA